MLPPPPRASAEQKTREEKENKQTGDQYYKGILKPINSKI